MSKLSKEVDAYIRELQRGAKASLTPIQQSILSIQNTPSKKYDFSDVHAEIEHASPGLGSRILDVLSRGVYASANTVNEAWKNQFDEPGTNGNLAGAFWEGLSGQKKTTYADVIETASPGAPPIIKALGGLAGDILLDPANLAVGGALSAFKGAKSATKGLEDIEKATEVATVTPALEHASHAAQTEIAPRQPLQLEGRTPRASEAEVIDAPIVVDSTGSAQLPGEAAFKVDDSPIVVDSTAQAEPGPVRAIPKSAVPPLDDVSPGAYELAVDHVIKEQIGRPSDIQKLLGVDYQTSMRVLKHMEKEGIVGKTFRKETKGGFSARGGYSNTRPVLVDSVENIPARKIVESNQKIEDAAVTANALAPDTVQALPVENAARSTVDVPKLESIDMGKLGKDAMDRGLSGLPKKPNGQGMLFGRHRSTALRSSVMPEWKAAVEARIAEGATPELRAADGTSYVMSSPHALDMLPADKVEDILFNAQWARTRKNESLYFSQIDAGIAEALRLDDLGVDMTERYKRVADVITSSKHASATRPVSSSLINDAARLFVDNTQTLRQSQFETAKAFAKKDLQDAGTIARAKSAQIIDAIQNKSLPTSQAIKELTNVGGSVGQMAKEIGASDNAASLAGQEAARLVGQVAPEADTTAARAATTIRNVRTREGFTPHAQESVDAATARLANAAANDAETLAKSLGIDTVNISNKVDVRTQGIFQALMNPIRTRFSFGYGMGNFAETLRAGEAVADKFAHNYHAALNQYNKQFSREIAARNFSAIKRNEVPADAEGFNKLQQFVDHIFDTDDALLGAFWRTGAGIGEINRALAAKGLRQYKFIHEADPAKVANQWRSWDITDPLDFLDKAHSALVHLAAKKAAGIEFSRLGSTVPKADAVKITANPESVLGNMLDTTKYYDRPTAEMFSRLEHMLNRPRSFRGEKGAIASIINNVVDPFLQLWKPFVTIIRPGHHVRNIIGDAFMTSMDGMLSLTSYKRAMQMMAAGGGLERRGLEGLRELEGGLKAGGDVMSTVRLKGRNQTLSYDNGYQLAVKHGLMQSFRTVEDFDEVTGKFVNKVMESLPLRIAGMASEKSSAVGRLAHFEKLMRSSKFTRQFKTLDEAAASAATRVRKFHPDARGLTPFETKYMRRLIPFYSWIRQAFPVVATTTISKPGRVTALPKTTYNAAIAAGMDPESLSDQFPTDKLYPSFVTDTITGPIGDYGYNLGSPQEGVFGDILNGNPARNLGSMLNPLIKTPIEFSTDRSIGTGSYIADKGEAIDQILPGVNQVANLSGYSPTGSVATLAQGLGLDPQRAVQRNEKTALLDGELARWLGQTSTINFLSGLGIQDYNKESYRKIALKEQ